MDIWGYVIQIFLLIIKFCFAFILYALPGVIIGIILKKVPIYPLILCIACFLVVYSASSITFTTAIQVAFILFGIASVFSLIRWIRAVHIYEVRNNPGFHNENFIAISILGIIVTCFMRVPHISNSEYALIARIILFLGIIALYTCYTETRNNYKKIIALSKSKSFFTQKDIFSLIQVKENQKKEDLAEKQNNLLLLAISIAQRQGLFLPVPINRPVCFIQSQYLSKQIEEIKSTLEITDYIFVDDLSSYLPVPISKNQLKVLVLDCLDSASLGHDKNQEIISRSEKNGNPCLCACCGQYIYEPVESSLGAVCSLVCASIVNDTIQTTHTKQSSHHNTVSLSGLTANSTQIAKVLKKQSYYVNQNTKGRHGLAAEVVNTDIDRLLGRHAKVLGADNAKNGSDRIVDGREIQCKYCKSAYASINAAFDESGIYRYLDANGNPMQLEVPRDQYDEAIKLMREKISAGRVSGVKDPDMAADLVRKGHITYNQSVNVAKFATIESIAVDLKEGCVTSVGPASISAVIVFVTQYCQSGDIDESIQASLQIGFTTLAKGTVQILVSAQVTKLANGSEIISNAVKGKVRSETIGTMAGQTIAFVLQNREIFAQWYQGNLATKEVITKSVSSAGGLIAGQAVATALGGGIPGLIVGGIVGRTVGKVLNNAIEDFTPHDEQKMHEIFLQELFIMANNFLLTNDEVISIQKAITANQYHMVLRNMFFSTDHYQYAASVIFPYIGQCYGNRTQFVE